MPWTNQQVRTYAEGQNRYQKGDETDNADDILHTTLMTTAEDAEDIYSTPYWWQPRMTISTPHLTDDSPGCWRYLGMLTFCPSVMYTDGNHKDVVNNYGWGVAQDGYNLAPCSHKAKHNFYSIVKANICMPPSPLHPSCIMFDYSLKCTIK